MDARIQCVARMASSDTIDRTLFRRELAGERTACVPAVFGCLLIALLAGCRGLHSPATIEANGFSVQAGKSRYLLEKGVKHYQRGELEPAATAFEQAVAANPTNAAAHNNLGLVRYEQHQLFHAATHFESAAELRPNDPRPLNNLGMTLEAGGKGFEAIEYYSLANELAPTNPLYLGNLLRTRIRLGENDESVIAQLKELRFIESRPDWIGWIDRQLALEMNPYLDRGPSVDLASAEGSNPLSRSQNDDAETYNPVLIDAALIDDVSDDAGMPNFDAREPMLMSPRSVITP